jgi:hypothetical protein
MPIRSESAQPHRSLSPGSGLPSTHRLRDLPTWSHGQPSDKPLIRDHHACTPRTGKEPRLHPQSTTDVRTSTFFFDGATRIPLFFETSRRMIPHYRDSIRKKMRLCFLLLSTSSSSAAARYDRAHDFFRIVPSFHLYYICIARRFWGPKRRAGCMPIPQKRIIARNIADPSID